MSAADAVRAIPNGARVFVHGAAATPTPLLEALVERSDLEGVTLYHLHTSGPARFAEPGAAGRFRSVSFFVGPALRGPSPRGAPTSSRCSFADSRAVLAPADPARRRPAPALAPGPARALHARHVGRRRARRRRHARMVVAEINDRMPRTLGHHAVPLHASTPSCGRTARSTSTGLGRDPVEARIGELIADLVEDGATLQVGIGAIPDAVLRRLGDKHELGVHTEMFSDGLVPLHEGGVITNTTKAVHPGRTVTCFVAGTAAALRFRRRQSDGRVPPLRSH